MATSPSPSPSLSPRTANYSRPWLSPKQTLIVDDIHDIVVCEAATKTGKTSAMMVWLLEKAMRAQQRGQNYWWVAPSFWQTRIPFTRFQLYLPPGIAQVNLSRMCLELGNGSKIYFKSGDNPDLLYGDDVFACVMDEATRMREATWIAIQSTLTATRGAVRIIGNVRGRKNWAHRLREDIKSGKVPGSEYKLTWRDAVEAGFTTQDTIELRRQTMSEWQFRELFEAEPSDDGGNPFGAQHITACVRSLSDDDPVVWGWDLAKKHDWVVGIALDKEGAACRFERWQSDWMVTARRIVEFTRGVPALVDSTGVGDPVLEMLQARGGNFEGFNFGGSSNPSQDVEGEITPPKQQLMEGLALAIQQRQVFFPEGLIRDELDSFEYKFSATRVKYGAPSGAFDDCVCALALAVRHYAMATTRARGPVVIMGDNPQDEWTMNLGGPSILDR